MSSRSLQDFKSELSEQLERELGAEASSGVRERERGEEKEYTMDSSHFDYAYCAL